MTRIFSILFLLLALETHGANVSVTLPATANDVVSAVPFDSVLGVVRYQQWFQGEAFGTNTVHFTNIVLVLQSPATNTLQFTNLVVTIAQSTNALGLTTNLNFNLTNATAKVVVLSTNYYTVNLTNANFALNLTNLNYLFQGATSLTNVLQTNLLIDVTMSLTNGCAFNGLSPGLGTTNNVQRAFGLTGFGGTNTALWLDVESLQTIFGGTIP